MADTPADALLALVPADGTQIGNQKLREQLAAQGHVLDEDGYNELRDQLVAAGKLAKGRGRGQGRLGSAPRSRHQPPPKKAQGGKARNGTAHLGFEEQLWAAADSAFPITQQGPPPHRRFRSSIPSLYHPLSTLNGRPCGLPPMTRGHG